MTNTEDMKLLSVQVGFFKQNSMQNDPGRRSICASGRPWRKCAWRAHSRAFERRDQGQRHRVWGTFQTQVSRSTEGKWTCSRADLTLRATSPHSVFRGAGKCGRAGRFRSLQGARASCLPSSKKDNLSQQTENFHIFIIFFLFDKN